MASTAWIDAVEPMTTTVPPACHDRDLAVHYACHVRILRESHLTGEGLRQQQRRSPIAIGTNETWVASPIVKAMPKATGMTDAEIVRGRVPAAHSGAAATKAPWYLYTPLYRHPLAGISSFHGEGWRSRTAFRHRWHRRWRPDL
jgi:hypothetical protein